MSLGVWATFRASVWVAISRPGSDRSGRTAVWGGYVASHCRCSKIPHMVPNLQSSPIKKRASELKCNHLLATYRLLPKVGTVLVFSDYYFLFLKQGKRLTISLIMREVQTEPANVKREKQCGHSCSIKLFGAHQNPRANFLLHVQHDDHGRGTLVAERSRVTLIPHHPRDWHHRGRDPMSTTTSNEVDAIPPLADRRHGCSKNNAMPPKRSLDLIPNSDCVFALEKEVRCRLLTCL